MPTRQCASEGTIPLCCRFCYGCAAPSPGTPHARILFRIDLCTRDRREHAFSGGGESGSPGRPARYCLEALRPGGLPAGAARGHRTPAGGRPRTPGGAHWRRQEPELPAARPAPRGHHLGDLPARVADARPGRRPGRLGDSRHLSRLYAHGGRNAHPPRRHRPGKIQPGLCRPGTLRRAGFPPPPGQARLSPGGSGRSALHQRMGA